MPTALPKLEGLHTIGVNAIGVNVNNAGLKFIQAGDYYWKSAPAQGGTGLSLLEAFQTLLTLPPGAVPNTTVTLNAATGKLMIQWGGGTVATSLAWANNLSRDRFGATANLPQASSITLTRQVRGLWLPNVVGSFTGSAASIGLPESDRKVTIARSGAVCATSSVERVRTAFRWRGLIKAKMTTADEVTGNESLETFWRDVLNFRGGIFRYHPDRTSDTSFTTWQCVLEAGLKPTRFKQQLDAVWDSGDIPAIRYVFAGAGGGF
jgi:hypothetical protein